MSRLSRRGLTALVSVLSAGIIGFGATPASAAGAALVGRGTISEGPYRIDGQCGAVAGISREFGKMTYAAEGSATASWADTATTTHQMEPGIPVATTVTCSVFDWDTGEVYGSWGGGAPGLTVVTPSTVVIPFTAQVGVTWCASALFSNGDRIDDCVTT